MHESIRSGLVCLCFGCPLLDMVEFVQTYKPSSVPQRFGQLDVLPIATVCVGNASDAGCRRSLPRTVAADVRR
jgi:hypothetical protein